MLTTIDVFFFVGLFLGLVSINSYQCLFCVLQVVMARTTVMLLVSVD